jgi:phenylalanyl-tRNA synthetase beta chain
LGIAIPKKDISEYLNSVDFETVWKGNTLEVVVPSFRAKDVLNSEDVVEEIARIYGYHNLPSKIMDGEIPARPGNPEFAFESKVKNALSGWGGVEVYTLSLVSNVAGAYGGASALKLKNPLGSDSEYLRTSLMPSLAAAAKENIGTFEKFHLFEMANVYLPKAKDLPEEKLMLAGIFSGYKYREAKGTVEALLQKLNIDIEFIAQDKNGFSASHVASIKSQGKEIGLVGVTDNNLTYYEFEVGKLMESSSPPKFQEISKYPSQKEDLTLTFPEKTKIGDVISAIKASSQLINKVELVDTFKGSSTIHVEYHDEDKTLTNEDVEKVRSQILTSVKSKFGGTLKD